MEDDLVAEAPRRSARPGDDPRRRYYRLTATGRAVLQEEGVRIVGLARNRQVRRLADEVGHE